MVYSQHHSTKTNARRENRIQALLFVAVLFVFFGANIRSGWQATRQKLVSDDENRQLSSFPRVHSLKRDLPRFAPAFENFYNDHAFARIQLNQLRSLILYQCFSSSSSPVVAIGKNKWLFWLIEPLTVDDPFTEEQLKLWAQLLQNRSDLLAAQKIKYVFTIVPEKSTVYADYLSPKLSFNPRTSRLMQLTAYIKTHTTVQFVDLLPVLAHEKKRHQVYLKTDTHWTDYGGLVAAAELGKKMSKFLPIKNIDKDSYHFTGKLISGDLARLLGLKNVVSEVTPALARDTKFLARTPSGGEASTVETSLRSQFVTVKKIGHLPRAFVLRDSFTIALMPYLSEQFSYVKYFWDQALPVRMLADAKPDVVIQEMAERNLYSLGYLDDLPLGLWPSYPNRQQILPPAAPIKKSLAVFDNETALEQVSITKTKSQIAVALTWTALKNCVPNDTIAIHLLDKDNQTLGRIDYPQNQSYLSLETGDRWQDNFSVDLSAGKQPAKLAIAIFKTKYFFNPVQSKHTDWNGYRAIFDLQP